MGTPTIDVRERDVFAPLFFAIALSLPGSKLYGNGDIPISAFEMLQGITVSRRVNKVWSGTMELFDRTGGTFGDALFVPQQTKVTICWNWAEQPGTEVSGMTPLPYRTYVGTAIKINQVFARAGTTYTLEFINGTVGESAAYDFVNGPRAWIPPVKLSDVVKKIADFFGWEHTRTVTDTNGGSKILDTIAATEGVYDRELIIPAHMSATQFIVQTIVPMAHDPAGNHFAFYFDQDNIVHFHPHSYMEDLSGRQFIAPYSRTYLVYNDPAGEVISFEPEDVSLFAAIRGTGVIYRGINSDSGIPTERVSKLGAGVKVSAPAGSGAAPTKLMGMGSLTGDDAMVMDPFSGKFVPSFQHLTTRKDIDVERMAVARQSEMATRALRARLVVKGTHAVNVMDYVKVNYLNQNGNPHYLTGFYQVIGIEDSVTRDSWTMSLELMRKGIPLIGSGSVTPSSGLDVDPEVGGQIANFPPPNTDTGE